MSRIAVLVIGASLFVGVTAASAQTAPDGTVNDPDVHQVVLDNEHVRVIRAMAGAGRKSPMHSHPPLLLVGIGTGRVKFGYPDGKSQIFDIGPGTVLWVDGVRALLGAPVRRGERRGGRGEGRQGGESGQGEVAPPAATRRSAYAVASPVTDATATGCPDAQARVAATAMRMACIPSRMVTGAGRPSRTLSTKSWSCAV